MLWSEPIGGKTNNDSSGSVESGELSTMYGETAYHSIRRFVVVKEREGHCLCMYVASLLKVQVTGGGLIFEDQS